MYGGLLRSLHIAAQRHNDDDNSDCNLRYQGATPSTGTDIDQRLSELS